MKRERKEDARRTGRLKRGLGLVYAAALLAAAPVMAASDADRPVKVGFMLPYSGTYAALGDGITNAFKMAIDQQGGKLGGRDIEYYSVDDASDPSKAVENANRLVKRDDVDVIIGTVHSGVSMALSKVARDSNTLLIVPNAGADEVTGVMCAPNIFRTSFSNWQPSYAMGGVVADQGHKKVVTLTWKYAGGEQMVAGFKESFEAKDGEIVKELYIPFPSVEFQPFLTEIASIKPDAVYVFFAGGGAVKFVQDYAAAGLNRNVPLYATGFLTEGTLEAQGAAAEGIHTTLHYADGLDTPRDNAFREAYKKTYKLEPDVYTVQGYDAAQLLIAGLNGVKGDISDQKGVIAAMESAKIDSPRGSFTMSKAHNPVQDIYLRKVQDKQNVVVGIASKALEDPARGCKL
ncbi:ABC transporter substrate-binding protein [Pusillimonas sp. DMV24BSW_D]|jgi:branched-chain amino acid transport system substrate-binding protein|uniref:ABC transporter permease n=1 Tax=Neopusillimonas maritima TaxID=2026239 RepID=A0ABX9N0L0_9BURK|nr:ABC transporter substrate-binding protein [Pusillimonas sp. DMV24BSW_D]RII83222.1 ABC transporter permease [Neopusillimonas maritima]